MARAKPWSEKPFWVAAVMQFALLTTASNLTETTQPQAPERSETSLYAWSSWGSWSACSRTCGGGVSYQERQCLPRIPSTLNSTLPTPVITVRVTRQAQPQDCVGMARRYHECNTKPCPHSLLDTRAEQCSSYDRRPFRGRFYTWVPYIDGDAPCVLNCRPLGHHFYASLSLAADGTPCTMQGFRAICVQGTCKAVGREVLSIAGTREVRCGRRLVSGLFARPRLPLGYSYITTVPQGACRLNVSEIAASDNYIALKITNGSYIMNGEFAVSAPGTYEAAGARFVYTRNTGLDSVFALGPLQYPVDIMILYTQPNPSIKYEYFTDAIPGEIDIESITKASPETTPKHIRRHHGLDKSRHLGFPKETYNDGIGENIVGNRKFLWKILSYTQCSRSCGGGFQVGKYRCVEASSSGDREVSPAHCTGSVPASKRRRCGNLQCPPRWRATTWSSCPECGPAMRTRIVGCVQDHSKGITKISDAKCPAPKPPTTEICNIPDCNSGGIRQIQTKRTKPQDQVDTFRDAPVYTITVNSSDLDVGPEYSFATAGWLYTDWSECTGWCVGGGIQTRAVRCADPSGCTPRQVPEHSRTCSPKVSCEPHEGQWFTGDWSPCTSCGGKQIRGVLCIGGSGRHLRDSACKPPKPEAERSCGGDCSPTWYTSDWGQCISNCTLHIGVQHRTVVCARSEAAVNDSLCVSARPQDTRSCAHKCDNVLASESQKVEMTSTHRTTIAIPEEKDCEDKLRNCALVVQARLCHYKYYIQNCCNSCSG
ncbi:thrombospondin type-1 domain-containing protein 4-like [Colias croceus]|uniref:thrombospondin type-1 domain-containing protein 4-like n=1 Tax=Colias crocea TaxID=72248 RepID=UPI001E27B5D2|nr:thrombospondin type-1 domain-containing protein 4-like [Colias croceus]